MPGLMQNEAEVSLPPADHTYALDRFPTDEVPTVLAFEEVESERAQVHQSLFSIVEEHAYAHRIQKLPDDEWTNFPDVAAPDCLDAGVQTDPLVDFQVPLPAPAAILDPVPMPAAANVELTSTESFVRFASATVSKSMLTPLRAVASRLGIAITASGPRIRCRRVADLVRLLCAAERPARVERRVASARNESGGSRAAVRQQSGRVASRFDLENLLGIKEEGGEEGEEEKEARGDDEELACGECGQHFTTKGSLTRHERGHRSTQARFNCPACPATYRRADSLREHRRMKHREMGGKFAFQCTSCFKLFKRKCVLQDHINKHIGARAYSCHLCPQKFTGRALLRYHMRSRHTEAVTQSPTALKGTE